MGLKRSTPEPAFKPSPGERYEGPRCFSDGFFYPVLNDEHSQEIGPARHMPLVWVADKNEAGGGHLEHAAPTDQSHYHTYGINPVELDPSVEGQG